MGAGPGQVQGGQGPLNLWGGSSPNANVAQGGAAANTSTVGGPAQAQSGYATSTPGQQYPPGLFDPQSMPFQDSAYLPPRVEQQANRSAMMESNLAARNASQVQPTFLTTAPAGWGSPYVPQPGRTIPAGSPDREQGPGVAPRAEQHPWLRDSAYLAPPAQQANPISRPYEGAVQNPANNAYLNLGTQLGGTPGHAKLAGMYMGRLADPSIESASDWANYDAALKHYGYENTYVQPGQELGYQQYVPPSAAGTSAPKGWRNNPFFASGDIGGGVAPGSTEHDVATGRRSDLDPNERLRRESEFGSHGSRLINQIGRARRRGEAVGPNAMNTFNQLLHQAENAPNPMQRNQAISSLNALQNQLGALFGGPGSPGVGMDGYGRWTP